MSRTGRVYIATVIDLVSSSSGSHSFDCTKRRWVHKGLQWLLLAALTLISGSASVELPRANVSISISEAFVFTAVLLYGSAAGTLTVALDGLVISFWVARRRPELHRALFNIAAPALSAWCSSELFFAVSGIAPLSQAEASLIQFLTVPGSVCGHVFRPQQLVDCVCHCPAASCQSIGCLARWISFGFH
jgi:hypothetical protein